MVLCDGDFRLDQAQPRRRGPVFDDHRHLHPWLLARQRAGRGQVHAFHAEAGGAERHDTGAQHGIAHQFDGGVVGIAQA